MHSSGFEVCTINSCFVESCCCSELDCAGNVSRSSSGCDQVSAFNRGWSFTLCTGNSREQSSGKSGAT